MEKDLFTLQKKLVVFDMKNETKAETSLIYRVSSAALAFLLWGGWAYYVNGEDGVTKQIVSSVTQGTASFIITLIMVRAITGIYRRLPSRWFKMLLPSIITVTITGSCVVLVHLLVGTPQILRTVAPAFSVAFMFSLYTTFKLRNSEQRISEQ